jgi:hypothetical protein
MNKYCKQLGKLELPEIAPEGLHLIQLSNVENRARYKYTEWCDESAPPTPLYMYALPDDLKDAVLRSLPRSLIAKEQPGVYFMHMPKPCVESVSLPPHVDKARRAALNIYLKCSNEITEFYDADDEAKTLTAVERFIAKPQEMWALDVSKPHAVLMTEAMERSAISVSFRKVRYAELISFFSEEVN